jgi:hypothetical protein
MLVTADRSASVMGQSVVRAAQAHEHRQCAPIDESARTVLDNNRSANSVSRIGEQVKQ